MRALRGIGASVLMLVVTVAQAAPAYVDARRYPDPATGWQRFLAMEKTLVRGFDDICGDTFCEGEYYNLRALRLRCSVHQGTGVLASCLWTFAGSATQVHGDGRIEMDVRNFTCPLPLAAGTSLETLLVTLESVPAGTALHTPLPGTADSVYDGLTTCL